MPVRQSSRNFYRCGAFSAAFPIEKLKMIKKSLRHWEPITDFLSGLCQSLYDVKEKPQLELCAPLEIRILMANYCTRCRWIFKGLSRMGSRPIFLETSAPHSLMITHRINLLSARSFSLDSNFIRTNVWFYHVFNSSRHFDWRCQKTACFDLANIQ